jgi:hypothetical protein
MTAPPRRRVQHCPLCGLAMLGSRSKEDIPHFDTFACLTCGTTMTFAPAPKGPEGSKPDR